MMEIGLALVEPSLQQPRIYIEAILENPHPIVSTIHMKYGLVI